MGPGTLVVNVFVGRCSGGRFGLSWQTGRNPRFRGCTSNLSHRPPLHSPLVQTPSPGAERTRLHAGEPWVAGRWCFGSSRSRSCQLPAGGVAGAGAGSRSITAAPASAPPATRSLCRGAARVPVEQRDTRVRCCKLDMGSVARVWAVRGVVGAEVARRVGRDENLDLAFFTLGAAAAPNLTRRNKPELQTRPWA